MAKTARDAQRHMRELGNLFRGSREVAEEVVDILIKHYEKRKYLKQSLQRLMDRGMIKRESSKLILTKKGVGFFRRYYGKSSVDSEKMKDQGWDGKWRLISFDVPGGYRVERARLRALLREFDFYPLHKSVWVCPAYMSKDFWKTVVEEDLYEYCKVMLVDIIEGDEEMREVFKLPKRV